MILKINKNNTMSNEQLNEAAEKYAEEKGFNNNDGEMFSRWVKTAYVSGIQSDAAQKYWNEQFELEKIRKDTLALLGEASELNSKLGTYPIQSEQLKQVVSDEEIEKLAEKQVELEGWGKFEGTSEQNGIKNSFIKGFKAALHIYRCKK